MKERERGGRVRVGFTSLTKVQFTHKMAYFPGECAVGHIQTRQMGKEQ